MHLVLLSGALGSTSGRWGVACHLRKPIVPRLPCREIKAGQGFPCRGRGKWLPAAARPTTTESRIAKPDTVSGAILYTEFDGRRPKRLIIKVLGE
jgi:hypothetical protein